MEEIDLKELLYIFKQRKAYIILITAIFIVLGVIYSYIFVMPAYQASTTLVLAKTDAANTNTTADSITQTDVTLNQKLVSTYSELVKSKVILRQVISNLGIDDAEEENLRKNITVSSVKDTELIEITVKNENPEYAANVANEIAKVFSAKVSEIYNINNIYVVDQAEVAKEPYNINHIRDIGVCAFLGIILGIAYALLINMIDNTVKTAEDIEKKTGISVLAQIPEYDFDGRAGGRR